jgi:four helix bundle protein
MKNDVSVKTHKDLDVWKKSMDFITLLYKVTTNFPKDEIYGLTNQMRRAAVSIPSNIAEGAARKSNKEYIQFLYIALGSAAELETQLLTSKNVNYIDDKSFDLLIKERDEIARMLFGLIRYRKSL